MSETNPEHPDWKRGWLVTEDGRCWWRETEDSSAWRLTELAHLPPGCEDKLTMAQEDLAKLIAKAAKLELLRDVVAAQSEVITGMFPNLVPGSRIADRLAGATGAYDAVLSIIGSDLG